MQLYQKSAPAVELTFLSKAWSMAELNQSGEISTGYIEQFAVGAAFCLLSSMTSNQ